MKPARSMPSVLLCLCLALLVVGCKGSVREDPILSLSAEESLAEGKELMSQEKFSRARTYLVHAFEVEPNSARGREALLLAADTLYLEGGNTNFLQAEAKYRDFLNRFPTSDRAAYAQFQMANSLAKRMERPDRDQSVTRKAQVAFEELLRQYPTTEFAAQARDQIRVVRDNLAEHEFVVGRFYLRYGIPAATAQRLEYLLETFPEYSAKDKALFYLGQAYDATGRTEDADATFKKLERQFPDSTFVGEIPKARKNRQRATGSPPEAAGDNKGGTP